MHATPAQEVLAEYLAAERSRTQVWLARVLGVSQSTISIWIRGKSRPGLGYALMIQYLTGIPADMWLTEAERLAVASVSVEAHRVLEQQARERSHRRAEAAVEPRQEEFAFAGYEADEAVTELPGDLAAAAMAMVVEEQDRAESHG